MLAFVALLLVALVGVVGARWAYKKYQQKQNQEFRYEGAMGSPKAGFDEEVFKTSVLTDSVLSDVVEKHQLVQVWSMADATAAKERIKQKFQVKVDAGVVKVSYQDKDKGLAKAVLESVVNAYYKKVQGGQPAAPPSAPLSQ